MIECLELIEASRDGCSFLSMDERLRRFGSVIRLSLSGAAIIGMVTFGRERSAEAQAPPPPQSIVGQGLPPCPSRVVRSFNAQGTPISNVELGPAPCELVERFLRATRTTRLYGRDASPLLAEVRVEYHDGTTFPTRTVVYPPQGDPPHQIIYSQGGREQRAQYTRPSLPASERSSPERP